VLGSFVNPISPENPDWRYLSIYVALLCLGAVFVYFLFSETIKKTLEAPIEREAESRDAGCE
jgi:hypothetical protein